MASGQQIAEQNFVAFHAWVVSKTDDDFREYVHKGKLNRSEIAAECRFSRSVLIQNPAIKRALEVLEVRLRGTGVLPSLIASTLSDNQELPMRDNDVKQRRYDSQRLNKLEQENAALRAELSAAKLMLGRYRLLAEFMDESGRMPR